MELYAIAMTTNAFKYCFLLECSVSRFDTIPECDGQMDRQTDRRTDGRTCLLWLYQRLHSLLC